MQAGERKHGLHLGCPFFGEPPSRSGASRKVDYLLSSLKALRLLSCVSLLSVFRKTPCSHISPPSWALS